MSARSTPAPVRRCRSSAAHRMSQPASRCRARWSARCCHQPVMRRPMRRRSRSGSASCAASRARACCVRRASCKLSDDHGGLLLLDGAAPVGEDIRQHLRLDDLLFTLKLTPNLGHALSVFGIARELAALTGAPLRQPPIAPVGPGHDDRLPVNVEASDLCGRFSGRIVRGVDTTARTPAWMVERLARCGQRSVSPLVDISNYVMFEYGQPTHIFDLDKIDGGLAGALGEAGRDAEAAQRQHGHARRAGRHHRRRRGGRVARRHHGRRRNRGVRQHAQHLHRGRLLVARGGGRAFAPLQLLDRRRPSLRARRRSGAHGRGDRAHQRAGDRGLRRPGRTGRRPDAGAAAAPAGGAARRPRRQGDRHADRHRAVPPGDAQPRPRFTESVEPMVATCCT